MAKKSKLKSLAATDSTKTPKRYLPYKSKAVSRVRQDVKSWNTALTQAQSDEPKNFTLQLLLKEIMLDGHLTSQIENRKQPTLSAGASLKNKAGDIDQEQTALLRKLGLARVFNNLIIDSINCGYNLLELELTETADGERTVNVIEIPRTNVVPQTGLFYEDYAEDAAISYRDMKEFGTWILEFNSGDLGLVNKAVPHVLFKRFAQSCWSELCEIYGIPPRVMKTNTQDPAALKRATSMMEDMGAAAWFIIDETENFEWASGVSTNGDVYNNLIALCKEEISLLFSGAVIGQDTKNGSRSKDESAQEMLWQLVQSDMAVIEQYWNKTIIPALVNIGVLKGDIYFEFEPAKDLSQLLTITRTVLPFYNVNPEWVKNTFGIDVTGERETPLQAGNNSKEELSFFG